MAEQDRHQSIPRSQQQAMILEEEAHPPAHHRDVIPDSLIALVKDARYIQECQSMFVKVLSTLLPRRHHPLLEQESWILASLLCMALGWRHTSHQTTLGMDALGLEFTRTSARWKWIAVSLGAWGCAYAFSPHRSSDLNSTTQNPANGSHRNGANVDEQLRGLSRREFHERQRQAMLQRANQAASNQPSNNHGSSTRNVSGTAQGRTFSVAALQQRIKSILLTLGRVLASAVLTPVEGPHTLPMEIHQQQQLHAVHGNTSVQQAGRWIAKLQLAHFCLTGLYPTWVHRLSGHAMVPSESPSRIHHPPTTARLVGLLLGAQAVATMIQASSSAASFWLVHRQQKQRQSRQSASETESSPAIVFKSESDEPSNASNPSSLGRSICAICKMERTHPSAPSACGHVFCWKCLLHWVSAIRPECPLCRATCRPQDIVALYNYEPANF